MMEVKVNYKKLNNYLNDIFLYLEKRNSFFLRNIYQMSVINDEFYVFMSEYDLPLGAKKNHLTYEDVYMLAREIIESINPDYLYDYDRLIESGELDFDYEGKYNGSYFQHFDSANLINIYREFTYDDVIILVHEFMHYTNGRTKNSKNRHLFGEFISIYFEIYATEYLISKGVPIDEININFRLANTDEVSISMHSYQTIFLAYSKFGAIGPDTINLLNEYYVSIDDLDFDKQCIKFLKRMEKIDASRKEPRKSFPEFESYQYLIGTMLAFYAREHCKMEDIVYLNDNITFELATTNPLEVLKKIGIDIKKREFITESLQIIGNYIEKYNNTKKR